MVETNNIFQSKQERKCLKLVKVNHQQIKAYLIQKNQDGKYLKHAKVNLIQRNIIKRYQSHAKVNFVLLKRNKIYQKHVEVKNMKHVEVDHFRMNIN